MALGFLQRRATTGNPILARCRDDSATRMRLKYAPYYHAPEEQAGPVVRLDGRDLIMLSSNDYLGLAWDPRVQEAARAALARWGTSTTGARLANGSRRFHTELEEELAAFLGTEACHVSSAGYISCLSAIAAFTGPGDLILADRSLHACMWDGIRLSGASAERFAHNSPAALREALEAAPPDQPKLLALEGVYSMEGHIAPLPELLAPARAAGCFTVLDDAHGLGVLGPRGEGTAAHFGLAGALDLICGSLSKSLASTGGFVAGSRAAIDYLRTHSRQTIFSAALAPAQAAAALAALRILRDEPHHRARLHANTARYKATLAALGLDTWGSDTPAVPIVLGTRERAYLFWKALLERGVFTVISIAPGVPPGRDLVRTAISAAHTDEHLDRIAEALAHAAKRCG